MAKQRKQPPPIDVSKMEISIAPLPSIRLTSSRGAYSELHNRIRAIRPTEWMLIAGSATWTREQKQAVRTSVKNLIRAEKLALRIGEESASGALVVFSTKCKGAPSEE